MAKDASYVELNDSALVAKLAESRAELFNLRFQLATGQLDNVSRIKQVKKEIARAITAQSVRRNSGAES
ncbi:MAG: 50S ribosomal protein L29 [Acidimicrobiia bacterium]